MSGELDVDQVPVIKRYLNGRDVTRKPRGVFVIDLFGLSAEEVRNKYPAVYQHVKENVKSERDQNKRKSYRDNWWIFGEPRANFRPALLGLDRYIATVETSKHRFFLFLDKEILPDNMLVNIASHDAYVLGVLSSLVHVIWALAAGGRLGVGNDPRYNKTRCFETFPFPDASEEQKSTIRALGEQIDAHRKRQQAQHTKLTLTGMYNVIEILKAGEPLTGKEKAINEQGLCEVLLELHEELDSAVLDAYGWPQDLSEDEILQQLVTLNAERAAEESHGKIRCLRPEYQAPEAKQAEAEVSTARAATKAQPAKEKQTWPKLLPERARVVHQVLRGLPGAGSSSDISALFKGGRNREAQISEILDTLTALGQVRRLDEDRYAVN